METSSPERPATAGIKALDPFPGSEEPRYAGLARVVTATWQETTRAFRALRAAFVAAVGLPARETPEALRRAGETFLREFAGPDRSPEGFASSATGDGIVQTTNLLSHAVGVGRARQLVPGIPEPAFTEAARRVVLERAFERLSDGSRLRFETRLDEIRAALVQAIESGGSPLETARALGTELDAYWQGRLRTICRTEAGLASEAALRETWSNSGIRRVEVIGDPNTDELCTSHIGETYYLTETDNLPLYHPNCFCSIVPAED